MTMKVLSAIVLLVLSGCAVRGSNVVNISTAEDLIEYSKDVKTSFNLGATVYLLNDIDFAGLSDLLQPIGDSSNLCFCGNFDGQGHTISNLITQNGLFGYICGGTVRNVIMDRSCVVTEVTAVGKDNDNYDKRRIVGGIINYAESRYVKSLVENNIFMGKIYFYNMFRENKEALIGGIIGHSSTYHSGLTVRNCASYAAILLSESTETVTIGGLIGRTASLYNDSQIVMHNCLNYGTITRSGATTDGMKIGGIIGEHISGAIVLDNLINVGTISIGSKASGNLENYIGSIAGCLSEASLTHSYWVGGSYDAVGHGGSVVESSCFDRKAFTLEKAVKVGNYTGVSLIDALNADVDMYSSSSSSKWILNRNSNAISFVVNNEKPFFKIDSQIVLMPGIADGVEKKFYGWFVDSYYTEPLAKFEVDTDTILYGMFV